MIDDGKPATIEDLTDPDHRMEAALLFGEEKDPKAVLPLIRTLEDELSRVRRMAAWALGEIDDPIAVSPLSNKLKDCISDVRCAAAIALGKIGDSRAVPALITALEDADRVVRLKAAEALRNIKDPKAIPHLIQRIRDDNDAQIFDMLGQALINIGKPSVDPLLEALSDNRIGGRISWALSRLAAKGEEVDLTKAEKQLKKSWKDEQNPERKEKVRRWALQAYIKISKSVAEAAGKKLPQDMLLEGTVKRPKKPYMYRAWKMQRVS